MFAIGLHYNYHLFTQKKCVSMQDDASFLLKKHVLKHNSEIVMNKSSNTLFCLADVANDTKKLS